MIPNAQFHERRRQPRRMGDGLAILIANRAFTLTDISISGVCFQGAGYKVGDRIQASLASLTALKEGVEVQMLVRAVGNSQIHAEFMPTNKLMRFIIGHLGEVTGSSPAYFK